MTNKPTLTLSQAIHRFDLSMAGGTKAESTRVLYRYTLRQLFAFLGDVELASITPDQLRHWRNKIHRKKLSVYTKHRNIRAVRRFFNWCIEEDYLDKSPARKLEPPTLPKGEPPKAITDVDMKKILRAAWNSSARDRAVVWLLAESGCRVGGLVGLRLEDVNLAEHWALVREKGQITRTIAFGEASAKAIQTYLEEERPLYVEGGTHRQKVKRLDDRLFLGNRGNLTVSGVYRLLERLAHESGVEGRFNPHAFRHALARRLLKNRADMGTVSTILGHSDMETTHQFYARWADFELLERHREYGGPIPGLDEDDQTPGLDENGNGSTPETKEDGNGSTPAEADHE